MKLEKKMVGLLKKSIKSKVKEQRRLKKIIPGEAEESSAFSDRRSGGKEVIH